MNRLVHVSLKYDCNSHFLQNLVEACQKTIKILDIEFSKQVGDDSVAYIKKLNNLVKINVFRTNLTTEGQVIFIYIL